MNVAVFIRHLRNLTLEIIFNAGCTAMKVGSKCHIGWNKFSHATSWQYNFHCRIPQNGSTGIICIICHQVLHHLSEHETSSIEKPLIPSAHIAKFNVLTVSEVTELTSSMVDETAVAILRGEGSWGISILSVQWNFILDSPVWSLLTQLTDKTLEAGSEGLWHVQISPWHMQSLFDSRLCFSSWSMESYVTSRATIVLYSIT